MVLTTYALESSASQTKSGIIETKQGSHNTFKPGGGDEINPETRPYQFGDTLEQIDFTSSIRNAQINHGIDSFTIKEDDLQISNERFSYSSKATSDAIWDWNMVNDKIYVGESYSLIFGHQFENNIITALECENFVHPEDRASYFEKIDKAIEGNDYKWFDEYRYLKSDGSYAYVNDKAIIINI